MNRRHFLQTIGALAATPVMLPLVPAFAGASTITVPTATYRWAEVIVRAHKTCSPAMLQRTLSVSPVVAEAVQSKLIANGVLGSQANVWGIYRATNPLFDGVFPKTDAVVSKAKDAIEKVVEPMFEDERESLASAGTFDVSANGLYDEAQWLEAQEIIARNTRS
ncbi:MAG: hypothetical protein ACR2PF_08515 [Rhizobiaceae bacterium]